MHTAASIMKSKGASGAILELIKMGRRIMGHFNWNLKGSKLLREKQANVGGP